jgi:mycothiol synthase
VGVQAYVDVPGAPPCPGLRFRRLAVPDDYRRLVAVHLASREADGFDAATVLGWSPDNAAEIARDFESVADPARDALVAEVDGEVVGYANVRSWVERDDLGVYLPLLWIAPEWRGRGVEDSMLAWGEARARELAAPQPSRGGWVYASNAVGTQPELIAALMRAGYKLAFSMVEMVLPELAQLPEPPMPDGYALKQAERADFRPIWEAIHAAYAVPGSLRPPPGEDAWRRFAENPRHDPRLWQVAWREDEVTAVVMGEVAGDRGEVTEVSVPPAHRRRGLARALLARVVNALIGRGVAHVRLRARGNNEQALPLYEPRLPCARRAHELPQVR